MKIIETFETEMCELAGDIEINQIRSKIIKTRHA